jgi:hypothetical protein
MKILTDEEIGKISGCHQVARAIEQAILERIGGLSRFSVASLITKAT